MIRQKVQRRVDSDKHVDHRYSVRLIGWTMVIALSLAQFVIPLLYGTPIGDDYTLIERTSQKTISTIWSSTWTGYFDNYGSPLTSHSDLYRPLVDLTFLADQQLGILFGGYNAYWTNWLIFTLLLIVTFEIYHRLFPRSPSPAMGVTALFAIHPSHSDTMLALANRTDTLAFLFAFGAFLAMLEGYERPRVGMAIAAVALSIAAILSKENAIVVCLLPLIAVFALRTFRGLRIGYRPAIRDAVVLSAIMGLYLLIRATVLFQGVGRYGSGISVRDSLLNLLKLIYYLLFGLEKFDPILYAVGWLIVPLAAVAAYLMFGKPSLLKRSLVIAAGAVVCYAPSMAYSGGKRSVYLSVCIALMIVPLLWEQTDTPSMRRALGVCVALLFAMYLSLWIQISIGAKYAYDLKRDLDTQMASARISSPNVFAIFPYYVDENAQLFPNGVREYIHTWSAFRGKNVVPLFLVSKSRRDVDYDITVRRGDDSTFEVIDNASSMRVPQLEMKLDRFDTRYFEMDITGRDARGNITGARIRSRLPDFDVVYYSGGAIHSLNEQEAKSSDR
jgi:hypothetical protein